MADSKASPSFSSVAAKVSTQPPSGFRDFLNKEAQARSRLMEIISATYQSFGFLPLETPALENIDVLIGSGGGVENEKLIFKVMKRGDKLKDALETKSESGIVDYGLRFDMTVPLSRVVANYRGAIQLPWKVFHIGPVWRAERPQKGRFREFTQCDVDIVGAKSIACEIEVIQAVSAALRAIGVTDLGLRLNDRRLLEALAIKAGFESDRVQDFAIILDKKDKIETSELLREFSELSGKPPNDLLKRLVSGDFTIDEAVEILPDVGGNLRLLMTQLNDLQLPLASILFDASLARGMGYYTGPIFELRHESAGYSLGGGGRYDRLIGRFAKQDIPACGFSLGFDRLLLLMANAEGARDDHRIFLPVFNEALRVPVLKLAQEIRQADLIADVYADEAKVKTQFKYASDAGYRWVVIAAEDEFAKKIVKIKDFQSQTETEVTRSELTAHLKKLVRP